MRLRLWLASLRRSSGVVTLLSDSELLALVCFDCCDCPIKKAAETAEIDFRSVFPNILRQDMLAEIQRRVDFARAITWF